jgi:hypothetical protein
LVWQARQEVLCKALTQVVEREIGQMEGALPWGVEKDINSETGHLIIQVDQGPPLGLKGRLDRLDKGPAKAVVSDYKHTSNEAGLREATNQELAGVTQFQLPVYMAAARQMMGCEGLALTGRLVPTLLAASKPRQLAYEADDSFFKIDENARQRLAEAGEPNLFNAIAELWRQISSGLFVALPEQQTCQYCDFRLACRAHPPSADNQTPADT